MSKKAENRIGIEFTTNEGYQVIVIDYVNYHKVQVMFLDEHKHKMWTNWQNLESGSLKNPFHKSVNGVGYLGLSNVTKKNGKLTKEYNLWKSMLDRCYSGKYASYENVTVCDRWLCYATFLEDLPKIKNYDLWKNGDKREYDLNKDLYYRDLGIVTNEKVYSLETCQFLPKRVNASVIAPHHTKRP